ncbi:hypothetical protein DFQ28_009163 [Apophysomyces sp. BC1034]|nr:hypothetical protein DFQ30_007822 [Apophysomyces sp. BC1015]KAG0179259.1 hypothetical protein DFQ29_002320 [Apophysomyces sp. BC1021]KAG0192438.1 hypothetical protein DFQ28_009163 [Apophysomyces sp. BC1034]
MYTLLSGLYNYLTQKEEYYVLIIGLDNAGKTTLLERIKSVYLGVPGLPPERIAPTVGLNIGKVDVKSTRINFWDLGGQRDLQTLWEKYYSECHGIVFVVDSTDGKRLEECKDTFETMITSDLVEGIPVLMLANKQDVPDAMRVEDIKEVFNKIAVKLGARDSRVLPVSALEGDWPPYDLDFLSISTINDKFRGDGNVAWYWSHAVGTWLFSLLIYRAILHNYREYVQLRRQYFESDEYQRSMHARTLLLYNLPTAMQSDEALGKWIKSMDLKYPVEQVFIGRSNGQLAKYVEEHDEAVRELEILLSNHLKDGDVVVGKRPTLRIGGFMCWGGQKVDAIDYYSDKVQTLGEKITKARDRVSTSKPTSYGWISFAKVSWAHATAKHLSSASSPLRRIAQGGAYHPRVELAPQPKDIVWGNLSLNEHVRNSKRLVASIVFYVFVFLWFIPSSFLSASSNVQAFIRLFPNSDQFIHDHTVFVSLLGSWFTPVVMAVFLLILPKILRMISQQQGYLTGTSLDRQVLAKLYTFFIVNNLLVFTVSSTMISMYLQINKAVQGAESLTAGEFFSSIGQNLTDIAKNMSDVSNFWVNYVSLKGVGVVMDLAQVVAFLSITLRKLLTRPSPRQLQEFTRPNTFDYPLFYNVIIFFFTVGLVYSVIAPLVLPFTLIYFLLATMVFRYLLTYVFVTGVETGGQIWRVLINRLLVSTLFFQVIMLGVLNLKRASGPAIFTGPLPFMTLAFKIYCHRRFDPHVYYYTPETEAPATDAPQPKRNVGFRFGDPAFFTELPVPMVHECVRHLLPQLYGARGKSTKKTQELTRQKSVRHLSIIRTSKGQELQFQSIEKEALELDDSTEGVKGFYKFEDEAMESVAPRSKQQQQQQQQQGTDRYAATRPLIGNADGGSDSEEEDDGKSMAGSTQTGIYNDLEYFVAGRAYRTHDPRNLDKHEVIEMAHIYRDNRQRQPPPPSKAQHRLLFHGNNGNVSEY